MSLRQRQQCDCEENLFWLNIVKSFLSACVPDYMDGRFWIKQSVISTVLTDFVHGDIESFQFWAAGQEVRRNILHTVLAHVKRLDLRQTQRHTKLSYTVTEKKTKRNNSCLHHSAIRRWVPDNRTLKWWVRLCGGIAQQTCKLSSTKLVAKLGHFGADSGKSRNCGKGNFQPFSSNFLFL